MMRIAYFTEKLKRNKLIKFNYRETIQIQLNIEPRPSQWYLIYIMTTL